MLSAGEKEIFFFLFLNQFGVAERIFKPSCLSCLLAAREGQKMHLLLLLPASCILNSEGAAVCHRLKLVRLLAAAPMMIVKAETAANASRRLQETACGKHRWWPLASSSRACLVCRRGRGRWSVRNEVQKKEQQHLNGKRPGKRARKGREPCTPFANPSQRHVYDAVERLEPIP